MKNQEYVTIFFPLKTSRTYTLNFVYHKNLKKLTKLFFNDRLYGVDGRK